ncbi:MAG TPA: DUF4115 domain-containing protein [Methylophilus sp.]|nr:DUF4115 domain-containing protein [Methylophilus sp.]HQQ33948.1 DUF4115 domain-containing protein [Methylophilus sp.]
MARKPKTKTDEKLEAAAAGQETSASAGTGQGAGIASEYRSRCGGALRTHREKQGLSLQTVAGRLRLSVKQIEALEADNFEALPEPTIVRGFIRNYAKQLGIAVDPLLDAYNVLVPNKALQSFTLEAVPYAGSSKQYKKPKMKSWMPFLFLALLVSSAWLFYESYVQKPNPVAPTAHNLPVPEPMPEAALPSAERQVEMPATTTEVPLSPAGTALPTQDVATETAANAPVAVTTETPVTQPMAPAASEPAPVAAPTSKLSRLEFSATQETWISVTDASGKEIYNRTLFAGNRDTLEAAPPLSVVVGNANGTSLSINGAETNLGPYTKVNVARIKVE